MSLLMTEREKFISDSSDRHVSRLEAEIKLIKAENDKLRKDAERYRWLRMADWWDSPVCAIRNPKEQAKLGADCPSRDRLDEVIDAEMAKSQ